MKLNSAISKFLTNKWVLNVVAFLAIFNIIGYAVIGKLNVVLYFIVFAVLVRYFSKNMTIVLGVPLLIVNLLSLRRNMIEGMENNDKPVNNGDKKTSNLIAKPSAKPESKPDAVSSQGLVMSSVASSEPKDNNAAQSTGGEQQGFEPGRRKNRGYNIDYATTIEDAYDELNNILGSDGIQRLTSDTQNLMKQQMQLAEAMGSMGKLVENIQPMVGQLQQMMGDSNNGMSGVMDLAKKMSNQPPTK